MKHIKQKDKEFCSQCKKKIGPSGGVAFKEEFKLCSFCISNANMKVIENAEVGKVTDKHLKTLKKIATQNASNYSPENVLDIKTIKQFVKG